MHVRNVLNESFLELESADDKDLYCYLLLSLPHNKAWHLLLEQYIINPEILLALSAHFYCYPEAHKKASNFLMITDLITLVLQTNDLLLRNYSELGTAAQRQQFIMGLLMSQDMQRNEIMRRQRHDVKNIVHMIAELKTASPDLQDIYFRFPNYVMLVNDLIRHAEYFQQMKQTPIPFMPKEDLKLVAELKKYIEDEDLLLDSIFKVELKDPVITPQGTTYERSQIMREIQARHKDPNDRSPLESRDLVANHLVAKLKELLEMPIIPLRQLYEMLLCPLSHELLIDPVVAQDGHTYSRAFLEAYLEEYDNILPGGMAQTKSLAADKYTNRMIKSLMASPKPEVMEKLITHCENFKSEQMGKLLTDCDAAISTYKALRVKEPRYAGSRLGDAKWPKLYNATLFSRLLHGDETWDSFSEKVNLKVLGRGRLGERSEPGLHEYIKQHCPKK